MKRTILLSAAIMALFISGCYYDVEEELYPEVDCDTSSATYSNTVQPLLADHCYVCHSAAVNTAGVTIEGYDNLRQYVDNGRFLGAIQHRPGFSPMPQGAAQLPECDILKIEQWIADGAPDN